MSPPTNLSDLWKMHDNTLARCWAAARDLRAKTDRIKRDLDSAYLDASDLEGTYIRRTRAIIEDPEDWIQRTWDLYAWARDEGKLCRPNNPFDAEHAFRCRYTKALALEDGTLIMPMQALVQLHSHLREMSEKVNALKYSS
jgi:hypothetical protein